MNDGGRKIWIGCGLGCALLAVLAVGSCVGGLSWLRGITAPLETAVETRRELEEAQGAPSDYRPPADGRIPADRWETFLAIREATDGERRRLGEALDALDLSEEELRELEEKGSWTAFGRALGLIRHSLSLAPRMGAFYEARNAAMLERGMGMGEYTWLHVLAFRSGPRRKRPPARRARRTTPASGSAATRSAGLRAAASTGTSSRSSSTWSARRASRSGRRRWRRSWRSCAATGRGASGRTACPSAWRRSWRRGAGGSARRRSRGSRGWSSPSSGRPAA